MKIIMKKSAIPAIARAALLCACPILQSCSDTSSQTTYATTSAPGDTPPQTTTTTTTTTDEPDSIVGSTVHAAATIIAAPFRLVGDALSIVF